MTNGTPVLGTAPQHLEVSNSEQKTYKECRRRWWLDYYRGLAPKQGPTQGPLVLGTRIHEALEQHYAFDRPLVEVYSRLSDVDRLRLLASDAFVGTDEVAAFDKEAELGRVMLEGYLDWIREEARDDGYEFVSAEQKISAPIMGGRVSLIGKVDSKWRRLIDDVIIMRDYKTAAQFTDYDRTAHMDEQTMHYQLIDHVNVSETAAGGVEFRLLKKVLRSGKAKPPFYRDLRVHHNTATLRSYWSRIHGTIGDMLATRERLDAGEDHRVVAYPSPTRDCSWKCPFYSICPTFDDGSRVEAAIEGNFETRNPYARYDQTGDATA